MLGGAGLISVIAAGNCFFTVEPGHAAIKFSKLTGLGSTKYREGWHFRIPYFETPIDFNV